jgi:hypothetical protein
MSVPQELASVVPLECFDEFVKELNKRCGRLIVQVERQAHDRQIIGLHRCDLSVQRAFLLTVRLDERCAARS